MAFIKGAFLGAIVGGGAAAAVSLVAPQPVVSLPPAAPQIDAPEQVAVVPEASRPAARAPQAEADAATQASVPEMAKPPAEPADPVTASDTPSQPLADAGDMAVLQTPDAAPEAQNLPANESAVLPNPQSLAPTEPQPEADIVVATESAVAVEVTTPAKQDIAAPDSDTAVIVTQTDDGTTQVSPATPVITVETAPGDAVNTEVTASAQAPDTNEGVVMALATPQSDTAALLQSTADPDRASRATAAPGALDQDRRTDSLPDVGSAPAPAPPVRAASKPAVVAIIDQPSTGLPVGRDDNVVIRRQGALPQNQRDAEDSAKGAPVAAAEPDQTGPALERYGAFFNNALDLPLMSIMLIDDGEMRGAVRALADVPFAVTILLDPAQENAAERMEAYAAAGIEVAALASLPQGATPTDVAVAMEGTFGALPKAVALVDPGTGGLPSGAGIVNQVVDVLASEGRGLVVPETGLNSALRAAEGAAVQAGMIYRDLDSNDQDARVIRRFIDQAAFRARQDDGVILLGRVRPETISALILWGTANRADQVALAPLSATLLAR